MKGQINILLVVAVVFALIVVVAASDDFNCRLRFVAEGGRSLDNLGPFRMYGPPRAPLTCQDVCEAHKMSYGFSYVGNQACCCAAHV